MTIQSDCKANTECSMSESTKQNAILLKLLHFFKIHALLFSVRFQHRSPHFAYTSASLMTQAKNVFLRSQDEQWQKDLESVVPIHQMFLA
jgi:hypothetical protein